MNNSITIVGRVGQAPRSTKFASGKSKASFSVAVKEFSAKEDEEDRVLWLDVEAWNGLAERVLATITRGREVVVNGRLAINQFKREDGTEVVKPVIRLVSYHLCGKKPAAAEADADKPAAGKAGKPSKKDSAA